MKKKDFEEIQKNLEILEIKINSENKTKNLCGHCSETELTKETLNQFFKKFSKNQQKENALIETVNKLVDLSKENQWHKDKQTLLNTLEDQSKCYHSVAGWKLIFSLHYAEASKTKNLSDFEKSFIFFLHAKPLKFSLSSIAFILDSSKSTISEFLKGDKN